MVLKNRIVWGFIRQFFKALFSGIYAVVSFLNLQLTVLLAVVGLILFLTGVFDKSGAVLVIFYACLIFSVVLAIILTVRKLLGLDKKRKKKRNFIATDEPQAERVKETDTPPVTEDSAKSAENAEDKPVYYAVKGREGYYMAEYGDRYELYVISDGKFVKIREDRK